MNTSRRPLALLAAIVSALMVAPLAGCSAGQPESPESPITPAAEFYQGTRRERQLEIYECLTAAGFEFELDEDEWGYTLTTPEGTSEEQAMAIGNAIEACSDQLPPAPFPQTDDDVRQMYDNQVALYECLVAAGFSPSTPPSFQVYLDDFRAERLDYDPHRAGLSHMEHDAALKACPRDVDSWW